MTDLSAAPLLETLARRGLRGSSVTRAGDLTGRLGADLDALERRLAGVFAIAPRDRARSAARHLLAGRGKRVRPALCLIAARIDGAGDAPAAALELAIAAELAHTATLLHDDVIDCGDTRRGRPTARVVLGNAASVLGGDHLLIESLAAIERAGDPHLIGTMLQTLRRMVEAETMQLERRDRIDTDVNAYIDICLGKTAALFVWLLEAGARSCGAVEAVDPLRECGRDLGLAFQIVDDVLDLERDAATVGKSVLQDIGQGTITYPVIPALHAEPALCERLQSATGGSIDAGLARDLAQAVHRHGGLEAARDRVTALTSRARDVLAALPRVVAVEVLDAFAVELAERTR